MRNRGVRETTHTRVEEPAREQPDDHRKKPSLRPDRTPGKDESALRTGSFARAEPGRGFPQGCLGSPGRYSGNGGQDLAPCGSPGRQSRADRDSDSERPSHHQGRTCLRLLGPAGGLSSNLAPLRNLLPLIRRAPHRRPGRHPGGTEKRRLGGHATQEGGNANETDTGRRPVARRRPERPRAKGKMINILKTTFLLALLTALIVLVGAHYGGRSGAALALAPAAGLHFTSYRVSHRVGLGATPAKTIPRAGAPGLCFPLGRPSRPPG